MQAIKEKSCIKNSIVNVLLKVLNTKNVTEIIFHHLEG